MGNHEEFETDDDDVDEFQENVDKHFPGADLSPSPYGSGDYIDDDGHVGCFPDENSDDM